MPDAAPDVPEAGQLVRIRGQQWVVAAVKQSSQPVGEIGIVTRPIPRLGQSVPLNRLEVEFTTHCVARERFGGQGGWA